MSDLTEHSPDQADELKHDRNCWRYAAQAGAARMKELDFKAERLEAERDEWEKKARYQGKMTRAALEWQDNAILRLQAAQELADAVKKAPQSPEVEAALSNYQAHVDQE